MTSPSAPWTAPGTKQKRGDQRKAVKHAGVLHYKGTQIPVALQDMSRSGTRISLNANHADLTLDGPATLEVLGALKLPLTIRWQKNSVFGASFDLPPSRKATFQQQIERVITRSGR